MTVICRVPTKEEGYWERYIIPYCIEEGKNLDSELNKAYNERSLVDIKIESPYFIKSNKYQNCQITKMFSINEELGIYAIFFEGKTVEKYFDVYNGEHTYE